MAGTIDSQAEVALKVIIQPLSIFQVIRDKAIGVEANITNHLGGGRFFSGFDPGIGAMQSTNGMYTSRSRVKSLCCGKY